MNIKASNLGNIFTRGTPGERRSRGPEGSTAFDSLQYKSGQGSRIVPPIGAVERSGTGYGSANQSLYAAKAMMNPYDLSNLSKMSNDNVRAGGTSKGLVSSSFMKNRQTQ